MVTRFSYKDVETFLNWIPYPNFVATMNSELDKHFEIVGYGRYDIIYTMGGITVCDLQFSGNTLYFIIMQQLNTHITYKSRKFQHRCAYEMYWLLHAYSYEFVLSNVKNLYFFGIKFPINTTTTNLDVFNQPDHRFRNAMKIWPEYTSVNMFMNDILVKR